MTVIFEIFEIPAPSEITRATTRETDDDANEGREGVSIGLTDHPRGCFSERRPDASGMKPRASGGNQPNTMTPVTVKMIKGALDARASPDDEIKVNGMAIMNITLVGKVVDVQTKGSQVVYRLDDSTGQTDVKVWLDSDGPVEEIPRGAYVRVYGTPKAVGTDQVIAAHTTESIRVITDFNEITYHLLEVIYASGYAAKVKSGGGATGVAPQSVYSAVQAAPNVAADGDMNGSLCDRVLFIVKNNPNGDTGISVLEVVEKLGGQFTDAAVRQELESLSNDGAVYTTVDEDHYQAV